MDTQDKTRTTVNIQNDSPKLIIDKAGKIIALNADFKKLYPQANAQSNFFEMLEEQKLLVIQRLFLDVRKSENVQSEIVDFEFDDKKISFKIEIAPLRSENNIYFIVTFYEFSKSATNSELQKFFISTSDIEKVIGDKSILHAINRVKLSFPFTFIEKAKIQKEINDLSGFFWIKDTSGKLILINEKYATSLGFKSIQMENKNEQDFLPKYLIDLNKTIDNYIIESTNSVIYEGITTPLTDLKGEDISIVKFPLCDLDNNVVAIIGFSQKKKEKTEPVKESFKSFLLKDIPSATIFIDKEFKIFSFSRDFVTLFNFNDRIDLNNVEITKVFEKGFIAHIETYYGNTSVKDEYSFSYVFLEKGGINPDVQMRKIFDENGEYFCIQINFSKKDDELSRNIAKANMYDALITHTPEAMFIYDTENLKFLEVNDSALTLYGYKRSDFLNMDLTDLYAPEDIQTLIQSSENKIVPGSFSGPWRHKKSDGSTVLVELSFSPIDFMHKKAHLNILRNVTEQTEAKKKIQILESAFESTSDLIINTDKDGFITEINEPVSKRLGYSKKDLETRPFISLLSDDDRAKVNKNIFHSGLLKKITLDVEFKKPSGNFQKASLFATPIKNYNGDIDSFSIMIRLSEEPAQGKDVDKTQEEVTGRIDPPFLSNIFHEILTPINVILGFTQELGESIPHQNDEQKEAVEIIKENQKLLLQIMDNAVEYSTLEQKVVKLRPEPIKFVDILNELKENTRKTSEDKKVELAYGKISSNLELETDRLKFISLLSLFVKFALQITKEDAIYLSAAVFEENYCAIKIKDHKNLITPYLLKAFNDIFSEDENMSRRNYGFSRFSVKLAKKLIELLSVRKITIMKEGEPMEYAFVFPNKFVIADKQKMELETIAAPVLGEIKASVKLNKMQKPDLPVEPPRPGDKKILNLTQLSCLYLEDQVDSQMLFKVQMKDLKSIEFAPSFESALPLLKTKMFDFIVMDINLQGEYNGLDALRIIQKMPGYQNIPIIASTAYMQPGARENFIAAGFNDFVSKPLLRDKLLEVLKKLF
jgi:PAS domain S-box-containing protein